MNSVAGGVKTLLNASVRLLNQPIVKEGVKNVAGSVTFVFGLIEVYDLYQMARGRKISSEKYETSLRWVQVSNKVVIVFAKISLILSASVSRPGVFVASSLVGRVFSIAQLERIFGPNTIFAINPWHPRHVISIVAAALALPSVVQSTYQGIHWVNKKIRHHPSLPHKLNGINWLTDAKLRLMILFNTITSRLILHLGNRLVRHVS